MKVSLVGTLMLSLDHFLPSKFGLLNYKLYTYLWKIGAIDPNLADFCIFCRKDCIKEDLAFR